MALAIRFALIARTRGFQFRYSEPNSHDGNRQQKGACCSRLVSAKTAKTKVQSIIT